MKSIKFVACLAAGMITLGTLSAQAAATLAISFTTYEQGSTTDALVTTYTSKAVTVKNADILAAFAHSLGVSLPAGAQLAISTTYDPADDVYPGDIVIIDAFGHVIWNLNDIGYGTNDDYYVDAYFDIYDGVTQQKNASKSTSYTGKGLGEIYIDIYDYLDGSGIYLYAYDDQGTLQYTRGNSGSQMTSGTLVFAGGGECYDYVTDEYQPANVTFVAASGAVPWSLFGLANID